MSSSGESDGDGDGDDGGGCGGSEPCCILSQNGEGHTAGSAKATSVVTKNKIRGSATFV